MTPQLVNYGLNTGLGNGERGHNVMMNHGQPVAQDKRNIVPHLKGTFQVEAWVVA
jgi:hypothetical protein